MQQSETDPETAFVVPATFMGFAIVVIVLPGLMKIPVVIVT
jgi:hypothetical protein